MLSRTPHRPKENSGNHIREIPRELISLLHSSHGSVHKATSSSPPTSVHYENKSFAKPQFGLDQPTVFIKEMLTVSRLAHSLNEEPSRTASLENKSYMLHTTVYVETSESRKITNGMHLWEPFEDRRRLVSLEFRIMMLPRTPKIPSTVPSLMQP